MNRDEVLEEARLFTKVAKNFIWFLVVLGCIVATLLLSSCVQTKTTTSHVRDTVYVEVHDTVTIETKDIL